MLRNAGWPCSTQLSINTHFNLSEMNQDDRPHIPHSLRSPPRKGHGSLSPNVETKQASGSGQKRASRAGTRSVNTLSAAQLERKRANDREAQRAIRARTRTHIETLEQRINDLTNTHENREKLMELTQQRNRELEEENAYLRSRVSGDTFALNVGENEEKSSEYSASAPSVSPQAPHLSGVGITRSASTSASRNNPVASIHAPVQHPESWRQHNAFSPTGSTATPFLAEPSQTSSTTSSASWRAQDVGNPQRHGTSTERNPWPGSTPSFSYQVRPNERTASYPAPTHSMSYTANSPAAQFQTAAANPAAPTAIGANFHAPGVSPQGDFQSLSLASPTAFTSPHNQGYHEQQPTSHAAYPGASVQVQVPTGYHGNSQEVHRGLAPPAYNAPAVSSNFMQSQGSHSIPNNYRESPGQTYTYNT